MDPGVVAISVAMASAPLGALITWLTNRRKNSGEFTHSIAGSAEMAVTTMREVVAQLKIELDDTRAELRETASALKAALIRISELETYIKDSNPRYSKTTLSLNKPQDGDLT